MIKKLVIFISLVCLYSCTKDKGIVPKPNVTETPAPVIKFVFVNRIGLKNDSVGNGNIDTVFQSLCTKVKYYYKEKDLTNLNSTCYNRNYYDQEFRLKDSIVIASYTLGINDKHAAEFQLYWKRNVNPYSVRNVNYATKKWPVGDTVKILRDTIIKFIWPIDTNSGKFIKTYQWP